MEHHDSAIDESMTGPQAAQITGSTLLGSVKATHEWKIRSEKYASLRIRQLTIAAVAVSPDRESIIFHEKCLQVQFSILSLPDVVAYEVCISSISLISVYAV